MADVELEIIDLSTGLSIGKFPLTICVQNAYELDIGSYRFRATHLQTGEVQEADVTIVEGINSPLDFTFAPPPTEVVVNPCTTIDGWKVYEGGGGTGRSLVRLNTTKSGITEPPSVELLAGMGAYGCWFAFTPFVVPLNLSQTPVLLFDLACDLQDPLTTIILAIVTYPNQTKYMYAPITPTAPFKRVSVDLRMDSESQIPDLTQIAWIELVASSGRAFTADTTTQIGNITAQEGPFMPLQMRIFPTKTSVLPATPVYFSSIVAGGVKPYGYNWVLDSATISTTSTCVAIAIELGEHTLTLTITDAEGTQLSTSATITVISVKPPPNNPGPWRTQGHKILDATGQEVYTRGIGRVGDIDSLTGNWGGKGEYIFDWAYKWRTDYANLATDMDETLQMFKSQWYLNAVRALAVVNWWWLDNVNPYLWAGEGPDQLISNRNYWSLLMSRMQAAGLHLIFCAFTLFDYYTNLGGEGGQPMALTAKGKAFMDTIDPDEVTAWKKWWTSVVQKLGGYTNIIWEIWNEPWDRDATAKQRFWTYVIEVYKTIRGLGDNHIIMIPWDWGFVPPGLTTERDLSWVPEIHNLLRMAIGGEPTNVVYVTHCYRHAPMFIPNWATTYEGVKAQLEAPTSVPMTRSNGIDVPLCITETGVMLEGFPSELQNDLGWFGGLLQATRELGIGVVPQMYLSKGWWQYSLALIDTDRVWYADQLTPAPSVSGQIYIGAYVPRLPPPPTPLPATLIGASLLGVFAILEGV